MKDCAELRVDGVFARDTAGMLRIVHTRSTAKQNTTSLVMERSLMSSTTVLQDAEKAAATAIASVESLLHSSDCSSLKEVAFLPSAAEFFFGISRDETDKHVLFQRDGDEGYLAISKRSAPLLYSIASKRLEVEEPARAQHWAFLLALLNPDHVGAWAALLQGLQSPSDRKVLSQRVRFNLALTEAVLKFVPAGPKCGTCWAHRRAVLAAAKERGVTVGNTTQLRSGHSRGTEEELVLAQLARKKSHYYAWNHWGRVSGKNACAPGIAGTACNVGPLCGVDTQIADAATGGGRSGTQPDAAAKAESFLLAARPAPGLAAVFGGKDASSGLEDPDSRAAVDSSAWHYTLSAIGQAATSGSLTGERQTAVRVRLWELADPTGPVEEVRLLAAQHALGGALCDDKTLAHFARMLHDQEADQAGMVPGPESLFSLLRLSQRVRDEGTSSALAVTLERYLAALERTCVKTDDRAALRTAQMARANLNSAKT